MVTFENKQTNLTKVSEALENNLNIIPSNSSLSTIVNKISDSRYTFKLLGETGTLPINNERPSFLVGDRLFVFGGNALGCGLIILNIKTMEVVKQVKISSTSITNLFAATFDEDYYFAGGSDLHQIIKGNVKTGEFIETKTISGLGAVHGVVVDNTYVYVITGLHKVYKLDKSLSVVQISDFDYTNPISIEQDETFLYIGGNGRDSYNNKNAIIKVQKSNLTITNTSISNSSQIRKILVDGDHIVCGNSIGEIRIFQKSDLTLTSLVYSSPNENAIRNIIKKLDFFWVGNNGGQTIVFSKDWIQKGVIQSGISDNYILEIDEYNKILYRNSNSDVTIAKYQIIDNLQNSTSTTAIKTTDLVTLNTEGAWVDTIYTLNGMTMTCDTLSNDYLRQLSFTGTTTADSAFIAHTFDVNKKLLPFRSYILNGVKNTDSLTTTFVRLTLAENPDGSGAVKVIEKVGGDFKFTTDGVSLYYKIEIIIKNGVTLSSVLYNNIPMIQPTMIEYSKGEGPYLLKDLSEIELTNMSSCFNLEILDGKVFIFATSANSGIIEVRDYQNDTLLTTINTGGNQASSAFTFDNTYIYIGCIKGTAKNIYIQRYNRCTLAYVDEYLLYTNALPAFLSMIYKDGYIYCACAGSVDTPSHRIRKWDASACSTTSEAFFNTPLSVSLSSYGLVVCGRNATSNTTDLQKIAILSYADLSIIQLLPNTNLSQGNWRFAVVHNNNLYACNDSGVFAKYGLTTYLLESEIVSSFGSSQIRGLQLIKDIGVAVADGFGRVYIYDYNVNLLKYLEFFPVSNNNVHALFIDKNNTFWYHSYQYPKVFKKQFIDLTKGVI